LSSTRLDTATEVAALVPHPRPAGDALPASVVHDTDRVLPGTRRLLIAFTALTLLAVTQLLLPTGHPFAWTVHERQNAAFLGAAYGAGFVLSVLALRETAWSRIRVAVVTVTAFTVLTLVPTLLHLHVLHLMAQDLFTRTTAWVWLGVYLLVPFVCLTAVVRQERRRQRPSVARPMPAPLVVLLLAQGAFLAAAGAVLYAGGAGLHMPVEAHRPLWPWPVTPLTSQVIGAWLLSFGFAVAVAVRERDLGRMFVPAVAYATFGLVELLVLVSYGTAPGTDAAWLWLDAAVLATLVPAGVYGAWAARNVRR
jgi:hypothetical protein